MTSSPPHPLPPFTLCAVAIVAVMLHVFIRYYRAMGAKVGRNVYLNSLLAKEFDLIEVGDGSSINAQVPATTGTQRAITGAVP